MTRLTAFIRLRMSIATHKLRSMTAEGQTLSRRSARLYATGRTFIWLFPIPFALVLFTPGLWRIPVAVIAIIIYVWVGLRAWRIEFRADSERVLIVNQWHTYSFPWTEVRRVAIVGARLPAVSFVLTDGHVRSAQASSYSRSLRSTAWSIAKTFAPDGVEFLDDSKLKRR